MARPGFASTNLHLHAGPSVGFPVIDTISSGSRVNIHGCLSGYAWCDVSWRGERGWADGDYLQFLYRGRRVLIVDYGDEIDFPILGFNIGTYWGHHYRHRSFYGRLGYWRRHFHGQHHPRAHHRSVRPGHAASGPHGHPRHHEHRASPVMGHRNHHVSRMPIGRGAGLHVGARPQHGRAFPHFGRGGVGVHRPHIHQAPHMGTLGGHAMPHPHVGGPHFGHGGGAPHPGGGHAGGHHGGGHPGGHQGPHNP
jgi:uncharacterized protein YraI